MWRNRVEGTNWAIPVDRIRMFMPHLVPSEAIGGFEVGLEVDMLADKGLVLNVLEGSSARATHSTGARLVACFMGTRPNRRKSDDHLKAAQTLFSLDRFRIESLKVESTR